MYKWKKRFPSHGVKADVAGTEIERLRKAGGGEITPLAVLEVAESKSSPLHRLFEWDNDTAAQDYRLIQAGGVLRALVVSVKVNGENTEIRAFVNITESDDDEPRSVFVSLTDAMNNVDQSKQVVATAYAELEGWQRRWSTYKALADAVAAVGKVLKRRGHRKAGKASSASRGAARHGADNAKQAERGLARSGAAKPGNAKPAGRGKAGRGLVWTTQGWHGKARRRLAY